MESARTVNGEFSQASQSVENTQKGKNGTRHIVEKRQVMSTTAFQSFESPLSLKNLEIPSNHTDVAAKRNIGRPPQAGAYIPSPEQLHRPSVRDTLYCPLTCTVVISLNGGSKFRLLMTTDRAPDVARGPRALKARLSFANEDPHIVEKRPSLVSDGFPALRASALP